MRVKEMHPLCCISLESPRIGKHSPEREPAALFRTRSLPVAGSHGNVAEGWETTVAGVLYKWTNYGKGWRSRWFLLRNGVLFYAKIRCPENLNLLTPSDVVRLIGEISTNRLARVDNPTTVTRRKHRKASSSGVVHLKEISKGQQIKDTSTGNTSDARSLESSDGADGLGVGLFQQRRSSTVIDMTSSQRRRTRPSLRRSSQSTPSSGFLPLARGRLWNSSQLETL